jgi:hypothetical protein
VSGPSKEKPYTREQQSGIAPTGCVQCHAPFSEHWRASRWTLSGFSPWCPKCHEAFAPAKKQRGAKPGPKPKYAVKGGWTNMPIN